MTRFRWITVFALVGATSGAALAFAETHQWGYVVSYDAFAILLFSPVVGAISLLFMMSRRSRRFGQFGLAMVLSLLSTFSVGLVVANQLGAWNEPMISFGPDVPASLVVVFQSSSSNSDISSFVDSVIGTPRPSGGHTHLPGLGSVAKISVGTHDAYALQFMPDATSQQKDEIRRRIAASPIVWRTFENIAPEKIVLPAG